MHSSINAFRGDARSNFSRIWQTDENIFFGVMTNPCEEIYYAVFYIPVFFCKLKMMMLIVECSGRKRPALFNVRKKEFFFLIQHLSFFIQRGHRNNTPMEWKL